MFLAEDWDSLSESQIRNFLRPISEKFKTEQYSRGYLLSQALILYHSPVRREIDQQNQRSRISELKPELLSGEPFIKSLYYLLMGQLFFFGGNDDEGAVKFYLEGKKYLDGAELIPLNYNLAKAYDWTGDIARAIEISSENLNLIEKYQYDSQLLYAYEQLADLYNSQGLYAKSIDYAFQALDEAKIRKNYNRMVGILNTIARGKNSLGDTKSAIQYLEKALELFPNPSVAAYERIYTLYHLSSFHNQPDQYKKAEMYINSAIKIARENQFYNEILSAQLQLVTIKSTQAKYLEMKAILDEIAKIDETYWDNISRSTYYLSLATVYFHLGNKTEVEEPLKKAIFFMEKYNTGLNIWWTYDLAKEYYASVGDLSKALYYQGLSHQIQLKMAQEKSEKLLYTRENKSLALENRHKELEIEHKNARLWLLMSFILAFVFIVLILLNRHKVIKQKNESLVIQKKIIKEQSDDLKSILSSIDQGVITIEPSLEINKEHSACLWSLLNLPKEQYKFNYADDFLRAIAQNENEVNRLHEILKNIFTKRRESIDEDLCRLPKSIDLDTKLLEIDWKTISNPEGQLERILVTVNDVTEVRNLERESFRYAEKIKGLQNQMTPHFLFNCLNSIDELVLNSPIEASEGIIKLSDFYRYVLVGMKAGNTWFLDNELNLTKWYLDLHKIRFRERLEYSFKIDDTVDIGAIHFPCLMLQTLVENSIKYAIALNPNKGKIAIELTSHEKKGYFLEVIDSGHGGFFSPNRPLNTSSTSTGLENTKSRLKHLYGEQSLFETTFGKEQSRVRLWFSGESID